MSRLEPLKISDPLDHLFPTVKPRFTATEEIIWGVLAKNLDRPVTKEALIKAIEGGEYDHDLDPARIAVWLTSMRSKIGDCYADPIMLIVGARGPKGSVMLRSWNKIQQELARRGMNLAELHEYNQQAVLTAENQRRTRSGRRQISVRVSAS